MTSFVYLKLMKFIKNKVEIGIILNKITAKFKIETMYNSVGDPEQIMNQVSLKMFNIVVN